MLNVARILREAKVLAIEEDNLYGWGDNWYLSGGALQLARDEPRDVPVWVIYLRRQPSVEKGVVS